MKLYIENKKKMEKIQAEMSILKILKHENIINLIDFPEIQTKFKDYFCYAIFELPNKGVYLFDNILNTGKFPENMARGYFHQLIEGN